MLRLVTITGCTDVLTPSAPDTHEVEDFLTTLMDQEFDTIVEDGSVAEV